MRTVILDGRGGLCPEDRRREKLAGHLNARLEEYVEEGIRSLIEGSGTVTAHFAGLDGAAVVQRLAEAGVFARAAGERVRFLMGADTTFEDLDYVQAAAAELL